MKKVLILVCALALTASVSFAKEAAKDTKKSEMKASCAMKTCAMCDKTISGKCETLKVKGKEVCFDSKDCKKMFKKDQKKNIAALEAKESQVVFCPVMKKEITVGTAFEKTAYKGKPVYLCCAGCKEAFAKDPKKYMKNLEKWEKAQAKKAKTKTKE